MSAASSRFWLCTVTSAPGSSAGGAALWPSGVSTKLPWLPVVSCPAAPAILQSALRQQQRPSLPLSPCRTGLSAASDVTPLYPPSSNAGRGSSAPTRHMAACTEKSHTHTHTLAWAVTQGPMYPLGESYYSSITSTTLRP